MLFKSVKNGAVTSLAIIAVIAGIATFGDLRLTSARANDSDDTYRQLTLFGDVFQRVRANYVENVTDEDLIEAAINGMLTSLDPHSTYLPDDNFKKVQQQTTGKFGGLGIEVTMENGFLKVVSPIDDTPAFDAGLQPEDLILSVDDESIVGITLSEAVEKLRGPIGSEVNITVQRADDEPFDVAIIRDEIKIRSVRSRLYEDIGYIRITTFSEQTSPGLKKAVEELTEEAENGLTGIVLDLRNNPGGLLSEAIKVTDAFLERGEIVSTRGRDNSDIQHAYARPGDITNGLPVVVLINSGSASASEIVAGALKDHRRAILMGTRSFGKGSVQSIMPMPGHGAIRLTTARYYTPSGVSIQAKGIAPDIEVALARIEKLNQGPIREEDLRGALDGSENEASENADNDDEQEDEPVDPSQIDFQLARALDLLRGLTIFKDLNLNS
ncbi:MAG: S41 family peptidase [Alphaproteobacteria bacterium]|nr:S41 family peptidase [Alphaproteobacteria bacterium]MBL6776104.1 S41 family peptidase [Alphaproteobacteria bacterium]